MLDVYRGTMSLRRLAVLVRQLPRDSNTARQIDEAAEWSTTDYLLAHVFDAINGLTWVTVESNRHKGRKAKYPEPIERPGARRAEPAVEVPHLHANELTVWLNGA